VRLKLKFDKCLEGDSKTGHYFLYGVKREDGTELSFFAPLEIHSQIVAHKLKAGSEFILRKVAAQNGKRINGELIFQLVQQNGAQEKPMKTNGNGADNFKSVMQQSLEDAIEIAKSLKDTAVQIDIQRIGMTMFIARTKINGFNA